MLKNIDEIARFNVDDLKNKKVTAAQNMELFKKHYGVNFKIPTLFIIDSHFVTDNVTIQLAKYIFPTYQNVKIKTIDQISDPDRDPIFDVNRDI